MKKIYILLFILTGWKTWAQNINKLEYFIDTDPGYGNATNVALSPTPVLNNFSFDVPLGSVSDGYHALYVRVRNSDNKWSMVQYRPFIKLSSSNISRVEYFIDTDPGFGNGTVVSFSAGATITDLSFDISIASLSEGIHTLYVRVKNSNNMWSMVQSRPFIKLPALPNIAYVEYYIDTDPGQGNGISVPITPAPTITDLNFSINVSSLSAGNHILYVRVKNSNNRWSILYNREFSVCNLAAPVANAATNITSDGFDISWGAVTGATSYIMELSEDDFASITYTNTVTYTNPRFFNFSSNTAYQFRVRAAGTCTSAYSNTIELTTLPCVTAPKPTIAISNEHSENPLLTSSADTGNKWYKDGVFIPGAINKTLTVTSPGVYKVRVGGDDCSSEFSDEVFLTITALEGGTDDIAFYPNPAEDQLSIYRLKKLSASKLIDITGKVHAIDFETSDGHYTANIKHLPSGVYLLYIMDGSMRKHIKFIKK